MFIIDWPQNLNLSSRPQNAPWEEFFIQKSKTNLFLSYGFASSLCCLRPPAGDPIMDEEDENKLIHPLGTAHNAIGRLDRKCQIFLAISNRVAQLSDSV